jgi:hypothetical protein
MKPQVATWAGSCLLADSSPASARSSIPPRKTTASQSRIVLLVRTLTDVPGRAPTRGVSTEIGGRLTYPDPAPVAAPSRSFTRSVGPSAPASTTIVSPSWTSPDSNIIASGSWISCWISRFSGRAPK